MKWQIMFIKKIGIYMYASLKIAKCATLKTTHYKYWLWYHLFAKTWEHNRLHLNYGVEFTSSCTQQDYRRSFLYILCSVTALCLTLEIPECQAVGHTSFMFPNFFGHNSVEDAMAHLTFYKNQSCSASSMYYLCNMLFPKCDPATGLLSYACQDHCTCECLFI